MSQITMFTDGGARGNPGPAALGAYITNEKNEELASISKYLGDATNNFAEYMAIIEGLKWILGYKKVNKIEKIVIFMDSQLAASQLKGLFKIKNDKIREMVFEIKALEQQLEAPIFYNHIPREKNKKADSLVNYALDSQLLND